MKLRVQGDHPQGKPMLLKRSVVLKPENSFTLPKNFQFNGTHRLPDALAPLMNVRRGAEGDKQTPNVTKSSGDFGSSTKTNVHIDFLTG